MTIVFASSPNKRQAVTQLFARFNNITSDSYYPYTTLLLSGNGTNGAQNNTFLDSGTANSGSGFTITRNGNTTQGTFSPFSQTEWGNYFNGTSAYLTLPYSTALQFTGDFTVEFWVYVVSKIALYPTIVNNYSTYTTNGGFAIFASHNGGTAGKYNVAFNGSFPVINSTTSIAYNTWQHIALVRSGTGSNNITLYVDGVANGTASSNATVTGTANNWWIGAGGDLVSNEYLNGYVSNLRAVKDVAVYTGAFTPPTSPLAATQTGGGNIAAITGTQTSLLTCQSNRFIDNSTNNFTITRNGDARVVAFSPFSPTSSWSAATYGGSGYFDGSGDYLSLGVNSAFSLGTGDFSIECWAYPLSTATNKVWIGAHQSGQADGYYIYLNPFQLQVYSNGGGGGGVTSSTAPTVNAWNHLLVTRQSGRLRCFLNGVLTDTNATSYTINQDGRDFRIGNLVGSAEITAYLSNVRFIKGSVPTDYQTSSTTVGASIFTPSTTAITTTSQGATAGNVSFLLNYTNAGIYDATSKNDLETVGNAQISNTTAQFGSTSIKFDGTGDYLTSNSATTDMYAFGSGDFTIEFWMYISVLGTSAVYDQRATGVSGATPLLYITSSTLRYYVSGADRITSSALSTGQWYHIAVARSGTSTKMFLNGTQAGSTYTDSTVYTNSSLRPFIGAESYNPGTNGFNGYIQDLRITKGYARYTANFTPPIAPFPTQ